MTLAHERASDFLEGTRRARRQIITPEGVPLAVDLADYGERLVAFVIGIWGFIELGCLRGSIGQNRYGPDPLAPDVLTPPVRTHA